MFGSLALLSGIALFSTAVALPAAPSVTTTPYLPATSTPSVSSTPPGIFLVLVGNLQGNTTYTPPYVVSQVLAAQPNPHTNTLPFRTHR
jgi:hypothetical protein